VKVKKALVKVLALLAIPIPVVWAINEDHCCCRDGQILNGEVITELLLHYFSCLIAMIHEVLDSNQ